MQKKKSSGQDQVFQGCFGKVCGFILKKKTRKRDFMVFINKRKNLSKKIKELIFERDKYCVKCGSTDRLVIDHILACDLGGAALDSKNLQALCHTCHLKKTLQDKQKIKEAKMENRKQIHLKIHPKCVDYPKHHSSCSHTKKPEAKK